MSDEKKVKSVCYLYEVRNGRHYRLARGETLGIGRAFDNHVVVEDGSASRHHASVQFDGDQIVITDLGSTNGTFVNGVLMKPSHPMPVTYADEIRVGDVVFKVYDQETVIIRNFRTNKVPGRTAVLSRKRSGES